MGFWGWAAVGLGAWILDRLLGDDPPKDEDGFVEDDDPIPDPPLDPTIEGGLNDLANDRYGKSYSDLDFTERIQVEEELKSRW